MTVATSSALINAVLAMDVYNRGVNAGLVVSFDQIGDYQVIAGSIVSEQGSFQAATYQRIGDPSTRVIAYRGTDQLADVAAWLGGAGIVGSITQFPEAEAYYLSWGTTAHVSLTGHSLGGGLAGYVAALNGKPAHVFDAMPFEFAAEVSYDRMHGLFGAIFSHPKARYSDIDTVSVSGEVLQYVRALAPPVEAVAALLQLGPVDGAVAIANAATGIAAEQSSVLGGGVNLGLDPVALHSIALLVLLQFASDNGYQSWKAAAAEQIAPLSDDAIAAAVGIPGASAASGQSSASGKMKTMIAYSSVTDASGYGNTAIQAFFNGGNALGSVTGAAAAAAYLKDSAVQKAVADIVTEYAALLAADRDEVTGSTVGVIGHEHGAIYHETNASRLVADFAADFWRRADTGTAADVLGRTALIDAVAAFGGEYAPLLEVAIAQLWGGQTGNLVELTAATTDAATVLAADAIPGLAAPAGGNGVLLLAGGGRDVLNGVAGNDLLIGGTGADTLNGGAGNDILVGGIGSTYIYDTGYGSDIIVNGTTTYAAATGELDFGPRLAADDLWFARSSNDLAIDILGTENTVTIAGWFSGASHQLAEIKAGGLELDGQVAQLVQAMAGYGAANPGFDPSGVAQAPADPQLQATIAAAWHAA